ncbi:MAG: MoaD/ThiS family protein [Candidatus Bathyarchaeia archaeon]
MIEIQIRVLYFGQARELSGTLEEFLSLPSPLYLDQAFSAIVRAHPQLEGIRHSLSVLVNGRSVADKIELKDGDRVALMPPVAGGS